MSSTSRRRWTPAASRTSTTSSAWRDSGNAKGRVSRRTPGLASTKAQLIIRSASSQREEKAGTKIFKMAMGDYSSNSHFEGTIQVIDIQSSAVVFAYNVKKGNFQSAAEAFAKHFKGDYLEKDK